MDAARLLAFIWLVMGPIFGRILFSPTTPLIPAASTRFITRDGNGICLFSVGDCRKSLITHHTTKAWSMSFSVITAELKSHPFSIHFFDLFLSKNTDLCAEMWNNSPNCYAARNSRERGYCSRRSRKWLSRTDTTGRRRLQQERCTRIKGPDVVTP